MNVTAGAFYVILQDQNVDVSLFSSVIFDECHYLKANRVHVEIMKKEQAEKNFKNIFKKFPSAAICFPKLDMNQQKTKMELISLFEEQKHFMKVAVNRMNTYLEKIINFCNHQHQTLQ